LFFELAASLLLGLQPHQFRILLSFLLSSLALLLSPLAFLLSLLLSL
jgi:hypothetical protein